MNLIISLYKKKMLYMLLMMSNIERGVVLLKMLILFFSFLLVKFWWFDFECVQMELKYGSVLIINMEMDRMIIRSEMMVYICKEKKSLKYYKL